MKRENSVGRKESYTASIMRSTDQIDAANKLKESLEANGIRVMCTGTTSSIHSQFIAHSKYVTVDYYADLKKEVPAVKSRQFVYEPGNFMCADTDFTVVLAGDNK